MQRATRTVAAGLTLALAALGAAPAVASPSADIAALGVDQRAPVAATSPFFAGYVGTGVGDASTSAVFKVPGTTCGDTDAGMVTTVWAISEDGEFLAGPDLFSYCAGGEFVLDGHVTTSGGQIPIWQELEPDDLVQMSISRRTEGPSTHDVTFTNLTRGWVSTLPTNSPVERIEIGQRRMSLNGVQLEVPSYRRAIFSDVLFDGVELAQSDATKTLLVDADGDRLIRVSEPRDDKFGMRSES